MLKVTRSNGLEFFVNPAHLVSIGHAPPTEAAPDGQSITVLHIEGVGAITCLGTADELHDDYLAAVAVNTPGVPTRQTVKAARKK